VLRVFEDAGLIARVWPLVFVVVVLVDCSVAWVLPGSRVIYSVAAMELGLAPDSQSTSVSLFPFAEPRFAVRFDLAL
jgi:hypothetical protein